MQLMNHNITIPDASITVSIKREDLLHPFISGNKFRKIKYNLLKTKELRHNTLITFGGAFSNHIAAVAYACQQENIQAIGIIRGEELEVKIHENPTLLFAQNCGMKFEFVTRETYRNKASECFIAELDAKYKKYYLLPEGGTNSLAIQGCEEILTPQDSNFDYICCAVGTGGTLSGIINSLLPHQTALGFPALKGDFLKEEICKFANQKNWKLINDYHFGGYAKVTEDLIDFINQFYKDTKIPLDPVYTGKMVFGVMDLIRKNYFPSGSKILLIHTGGLQGIVGMNQFLENKKMTKIVFDE